MNQGANHVRDRNQLATLRVQIIGPWPVINAGVSAVVQEECAGDAKVRNTIAVNMDHAFADLIHTETQLLIVILTAGSLPARAFDTFLGQGGRHVLMALPEEGYSSQIQGRGFTCIPFGGGIRQWRQAIRQALAKLKTSGSGAQGKKIAGSDPARMPRNGVNRLLTPRQAQVCGLIARGLSNKDIASELGLSVGTVKLHVAAVLRALDARNRIEVLVRNAKSSATSALGFGGGLGALLPPHKVSC